ncbi:hypothetical protein RvY_06403 [Ramazzottius varieornatus]|uniref:G-protein coupled receptors family 1 profile domain-containing protein n=1 Tax=Ramazzottius varieornatus TaxID=947166 RepID=A0A1D1UYG3_RAMVA|nr:hypothetical protein RvY_06403 [Ramazzottius varieornatus]
MDPTLYKMTVPCLSQQLAFHICLDVSKIPGYTGTNAKAAQGRQVTFPLRSAATRNLTFVLLMIMACWVGSAQIYWACMERADGQTQDLFLQVVSGLISIPPLIGWNDMSDEANQCGYVSEKGYIIYSSLGSFYIPLCILVSVYLTIFISARRRLRRRAMGNNPYTTASTIVLPTGQAKPSQE